MSSKFSLVAKLPWLFCHRIRRVKRSLTMASQTSALTLKLKNSNFYIEMFLTESVWFSLFKVVKNIWQCIFAFAIHKIPRRCEVLKDLDVIDPDWFLIRKKLFISFASSPNLFFFRCSFFFAANFFKEDWFLRRHHSVWQSSQKKKTFFHNFWRILIFPFRPWCNVMKLSIRLMRHFWVIFKHCVKEMIR